MPQTPSTNRDVVRWILVRTGVALLAGLPIAAFGCLLICGRGLSSSYTGWHFILWGLVLAVVEIVIVTPPITWRSAHLLQTVNRLREDLERLASTDPLTGLLNRRGFDEGVRRLATDGPVAALICDLDHFKHVNDRYGHDFGDVVLRATADLLREAVARNPSICVGRQGGEEFVAVLPGADLDTARRWAETLRASFAAQSIEGPHGPVRLTLSVGVAAVRRYDGRISRLISRADAALYRAKRDGRNRVAVHNDNLLHVNAA